MIKFYQAVREGWGKEPAIARFLQDGIWVFALPFSKSASVPCSSRECDR